MNPYEVLGVNENDDDETIKRAYRELVKKYHPDRYINNPLADIAGEKIKQINDAYDTISDMRAGRTYRGDTQSTGQGRNSAARENAQYSSGRTYGESAGGSVNADFQALRSLIKYGNLAEAKELLRRLPRTAEWYYLSGLICMSKGWYIQAHRNISRAVQMEPDNDEYRATLNVMNENADGYREFSEDKKHISMKDCYFEDDIKKYLSLLSCAAGCCICFDCYCDWCMGVRPMLQICKHTL